MLKVEVAEAKWPHKVYNSLSSHYVLQDKYLQKLSNMAICSNVTKKKLK